MSSDSISNTSHVVTEKSESPDSMQVMAPSSTAPPDSVSFSPLTLSTSDLPSKIYLRSLKMKVSTQITVQLQTLDTGSKLTVTALLDSGATGMFLDTKFVLANNLNTRKLPRAIPVYNVDGTLN